MAFKQISDLSADLTISLGGMNNKTGKANPTSVEGYFLGTREVQTGDSKSQLHFFQTSKGNVAVWGKTDITKKLSSVTPGMMTRVTFKEKVKVAKGMMYKYDVAVDDENTIEVGGPAAPKASFQSNDEDEEYLASEEANEDDGGDNDDVLQAQALAAAERKAKLNALLKNKKGA